MIRRKHFIDVVVLGILAILAIAGGLAYAEGTSVDSQTQEQLQKIEEKLATSSANPANPTAKKAVHTLGTLSAVNGTSLLLTTNSSLVTVLTDAKTKFITLGPKTDIKISDLKVGDRLAVVGVGPSETIGLSSIVTKVPAKTSHTAAFGKISAVSATSLALIHIKFTETSLGSINLTSDTVIKSANKSLTAADLKTDELVAISGTVDEKGATTAKLVQILP